MAGSCRASPKAVAKDRQKEFKSKACEVNKGFHVTESKLVPKNSEKGKLQTNLKKFFVHLKGAPSPSKSARNILSKFKVENHSPKIEIMENAETSSVSSYSFSSVGSSCPVLPENDSATSPIASLQDRSPLSIMPKSSLCNVATSTPLTPSSLLTRTPCSKNRENLSHSQTPESLESLESNMLETPKSSLSCPLYGRNQVSRASERKSCLIDRAKSITSDKAIKIIDLTGNGCVQESSKVACITKVVRTESSPNDLTKLPVEKENLDKVATKLLQFSFDSSKSPRNRRFTGNLPNQLDQGVQKNINVGDNEGHIADSVSFKNGGHKITNSEAQRLENKDFIAITDTPSLQCIRPGDANNKNNNKSNKDNGNETEVSIITKSAKQESIITKQEPSKISSKPKRRKDIVIDIYLLLDNSGPATRRSKAKRQNAAVEVEGMSAKKAKMVRIFYFVLYSDKTCCIRSKHKDHGGPTV